MPGKVVEEDDGSILMPRVISPLAVRRLTPAMNGIKELGNQQARRRVYCYINKTKMVRGGVGIEKERRQEFENGRRDEAKVNSKEARRCALTVTAICTTADNYSYR